MTSQTISAGNIYRLTLTVDKAFLTDPDTVYPVSIDPELKVSDNTHGSGAIEDVNIYEGTPNATANWSYMHVGYYDSTYKRGRILVRLTGLLNHSEYQSMSSSQITSATFHLKEATGKAAAYIQLRAYSGSPTWTETGATWNNTEDTLGTLITTVSHGRSVVAAYDITTLVKGWKDGTYDEDCGFLLCHANETTATKGFYSSEYSSDTSYRPYVMVTYTELESSAEVYITSTKNDVDEDCSLVLTAVTSPAGQSVTWGSSNSAIASVNSSGEVSGKKAGEVTITATLENGNSDTYRIYVTLVDGVYRIKNNHSNFYLGVQNSGYEGAIVTQQTKAESGISQLSQLWKIQHLGAGRYTVRPMHKVNAALNGYNTGFVISDIGIDDQMIYNMPLTNFSVAYYVNGYVFQSNDFDAYSMAPRAFTTAVNAPVIGTSFTGASLAFRWSLELVPGVFLYDTATYKGILTGSTQYMELDYPRAVAGMITSGNVEATSWSCNNPLNATIDVQSGAVTPKKRSTVTITGSAIIDDEIIEIPFNLIIRETIYVDSYYDSTLEGETELLGYIDDAIDYLNVVYNQDFYLYFASDGAPTKYGNDPISICPIHNDGDCDDSNAVCGSDCTKHCKNLRRISDELYNSHHDQNHLVVMWSNCTDNIFCMYEPNSYTASGDPYNIRHTPKSALGLVINHRPVIQILSINQLATFQSNVGKYDELHVMSITLAHEVAHTLGLEEIANGVYPNTPDHDREDAEQCIMSYLFVNEHYGVYEKGADALCDFCRSRLAEEIDGNVFQN